ncbi:stalk domain-containing protein [Paenibacillus oryzisoli]|uniref:stalk domain-containing protein n=1 Tax=Paenibacillus oryzisoli TaxID=1850517 RepID=UPI003D280950
MLKIGLALVLGTASLLPAGLRAEAASVKSLTLKEAMDRGVKVSAQMRDAKNDILKKQLELEQAQQAVKSEEAKAQGLFAKAHNLNQDMSVKLKVPDARSQLFISRETFRQTATNVGYEVEKAYMTAYQDLSAEGRSRTKLDQAKAALDAVRTKRKYNLASPEDQDKAEKALEEATSNYKQAQLTAKASRLALGKLLQLDMENPVALEFRPFWADLNQAVLPALIDRGQKTTLSLLKDTESRRLADEKLNVTKDLLSAKFGAARMRVMEAMYKSTDIDMDLFQSSYDATLEQVKQDWQGYFWLLGFIPIPKSLLQGEFDGLRYLDDLHNALPIATIEQGKATQQEKDSRTAVIADIRGAFLEAKGTEETYAQTLRDRDRAVDELAKANQKAKLSLLKQDELQLFKDAVSQAEQGIQLAQIGYMLAIGKLDTATGGAVSRSYRDGIIPYHDLDDGLSAVKTQKPKAPLGTWKIKQAVGPLLSDFSLTVSKKLGATEYAVFTKDGKPIGKKTKVNKPLRNLTLKFSEPDALKVVLYAKGKKITELPLEGKGSAGQLIDPAQDGDAAAGAGNGGSNGSADGAAGAGGTGSGTGTGGAADGGSGNGGSSAGQGAGSDDSGTGDSEGDASGTEAGLGTVIIGTYKVNLDALTPEAFNAASATMTESGQGMLYKPDAPGASWIGMDNITDSDALANPPSSAVLSQAAVAAIKLTVAIDKPGEIASTQTPEELAKQIETLKKDVEKLEADKEAAVTAMKLMDIASLSAQLKEAQAKLGMMEALQKGDSQAALAQMALVNNPDALVAAMAEEASEPTEPGSGTGTGTGTTDPGSGTGTGNGTNPGSGTGTGNGTTDPGSGTGTGNGTTEPGTSPGSGTGTTPGGSGAAGSPASEDQLAAQAELQQAKLEQALAAGEPEAAAALLQQLLATQAQLADAQSGASEGTASLDAAKQKLQAALSAAQAQRETERAAELAASLAAVDEAKQSMQKDALFAQLDAVTSLTAELPPSPGVQQKLEQQTDELLAKLKEQEKAKYAPEELQELAATAYALAQTTAIDTSEEPATIRPLPPESVISPNIFIKFTAPPVIINGQAYLPIRSVSESFGAAVDWDPDTYTVTVSTEYTTVTSTINQDTAYIDGIPTQNDGPSLLLEGRTYVPMRFIAESLGLQVDWNEAMKMIQIAK